MDVISCHTTLLFFYEIKYLAYREILGRIPQDIQIELNIEHNNIKYKIKNQVEQIIRFQTII